jgi:tRNA 2-thiouridine synthesizing protein A
MENVTPDSVLDTCGKCCPMPIVETNHAIKSLEPGQVLEIVATDIGTQKDIPSWCVRTGNTLLGSESENKTYRYYVRKGC